MTASQTEPVSFQDPAKLKSQYQEQKLLAEIERFVGHDLSHSKRDIIKCQTNGSLQVFNAWSVMKGVMLVLQKHQNKWNWDDRVIVWHIVNCYSLSFSCWWRGHHPRSSSSGIHVFWDGKTEGPPIVVPAKGIDVNLKERMIWNH